MKTVSSLCALAFVSGLIILMSGCTMLPGGIAASTVPIEGRSYTNLGRVTKTDSRIHLFGFIPVSGANTTRGAIEEAVNSKRGDAMINVSVESYFQWWIILTRAVTRVDGEVIRFDHQQRSASVQEKDD